MIDLSTVDLVTIAIYFLIIFYTAFFLTRKDKKSGESSDYFLAGRNLSWFLVGSSLFASNIGSEHLIGLAGTGASSGVAVAQFEILACFILLLLGWFFVPFYLKSGVFTMPEFLEMRFSSGARMYLSIISVLAYVITKISATIYAGAVVFETIGVPFWTGASIVVIATGIYTVFGGLRAVIYTDAVQMVIMILGSILLTIFGLNQLGGWGELQATIPADFMTMWKPMEHKDFPWTGIIFLEHQYLEYGTGVLINSSFNVSFQLKTLPKREEARFLGDFFKSPSSFYLCYTRAYCLRFISKRSS